MAEMNLIETIRDSLSKWNPILIDNPEDLYTHASVLIPLFKEDGQYKVLFTRRTNKVERHKGQISFPGGAVDEEDSSVEETALREAFEEIGLLQKDVNLLGRVDDLITVTDFIVHPFVGEIPFPYSFAINAHEVDSIITIPMSIFLEKGATTGVSIEVDGFTYDGPYFRYQGQTVWGATARIMENFVEIIGKK